MAIEEYTDCKTKHELIELAIKRTGSTFQHSGDEGSFYTTQGLAKSGLEFGSLFLPGGSKVYAYIDVPNEGDFDENTTYFMKLSEYRRELEERGYEGDLRAIEFDQSISYICTPKIYNTQDLERILADFDVGAESRF